MLLFRLEIYMKGLVVRVSTIDRDGDEFPNGSECFTVDIKARRGTPEYDALWNAFHPKSRKRIEIYLTPQ